MNAPLERSTAEEAERHGLAWAAWPADRATPVSAFLGLRAAGRHACLLESVEGPARLARYSFLGADPSARFRAGADGARVERLRGSSGAALSAGVVERVEGSPHEALRRVALAASRAAPGTLPPFAGGWIGWFAFEWATRLEPRVPRARSDPWKTPDATLDLYERVLAFDHAAQKLWAICPCASAREHARAQDELAALAHDALRSGVESGAFHLAGEIEPRTEPAEFRAGVERLRHAIAHGEIFQAVLSQRFEVGFDGDPFTLYRVLRIANPSPHMFFFEADGLTLIGSSPERLVSVRGRRAENRPIAGTRPRAADPREDERLSDELRSDPKERAEHDMLVDLARNDLGRVARIGTVRVKEHAALERFARVQHLVSRVECEIGSGFDALDALAASFPAGTVSGAPKVRALELLADVERDTRGPYAGAFGYLDRAGNLDTALCLRTFVARDGVLSAQAGAGVVFDSDPEKERLETLDKARALFDAAAIADSDAFRPSVPASSSSRGRESRASTSRGSAREDREASP